MASIFRPPVNIPPEQPCELAANLPAASLEIPAWRAAGLRYFGLNFFLRRKFGSRVQKVSLDAGFTCPNVDGSVATGGCTFGPHSVAVAPAIDSK